MRLNLTQDPEWYMLVPEAGIRVLADAATASIFDDAREDPRLLALKPDVPENAEDLESFEIDKAAATKMSRALALIIAEQVIVDWEGVEDANGGKAPVTPEYIGAFLEHNVAADAWVPKYMTRWMTIQKAVAEEKKDSAPSLTGTTAAARNTAQRARQSAKAAPAKKTARKA